MLDPDLIGSDNKANISGTVFTFYQPASPIKDVSVKLSPGGEIILTDSDGFFQFGNLNPGTYQLLVQKDNYLADSLQISLESGEQAQGINFF